MFMDVVELREFYASALGSASQSSIFRALSSMAKPGNSERFLGMGYPIPWMEAYSEIPERSLVFMPAGQGALHWPDQNACATALVFDDELPLADSTIDKILMVHFLEHAENASECLAEAWRVLSPGGILLAVVPNRRGVWARFEHTPFGTGRPYSKSQLNTLLRDNQFTPEVWSDALHFAPSSREFLLRVRKSMERVGQNLWPVFSGVICVKASKQLYQGIPVAARAKRRVLIPVLVPEGTNRTNSDDTK